MRFQDLAHPDDLAASRRQLEPAIKASNGEIDSCGCASGTSARVEQ